MPRLAWGDFLERARQPAFLVSLLAMVGLAHGMMPPADAPYRTFTLNDLYRPAYGAAWTGTLVALLTGVYLMFAGFYLVRGTVERDRRTGVAAILGASRMGRFSYVAAKGLSHLLVFAAMAVVAAGVALATQQLLGEDRRIDVLATLAPFVWLTLPLAAFTAASAVLFDCVAATRGMFGNLAWFFLLGVLLSTGAVRNGGEDDFTGVRPVSNSVRAAMHATIPGSRASDTELSVGVNVSPRWKQVRARTFAWAGTTLSPSAAAGRVSVLAVALVVLAAAGLLFDRSGQPLGSRAGKREPWGSRLATFRRRGWTTTRAPVGHAADLAPAERAFRFGALVAAELRLLVQGLPAPWWLGVIALAIGQCFAPLGPLRTVWLPIASFWPVFAWSSLGARERRHDTVGILFSVARPVSRLIFAGWLAGALLGVFIGAVGVLRLAAAGEAHAALGWLVGSACVPAVAFALGAWTGSGRCFEVLLLFAWYVGPMHHVGALDYTGVTTTRPVGVTFAYATLAVVSLVVAAVARRRAFRR